MAPAKLDLYAEHRDEYVAPREPALVRAQHGVHDEDVRALRRGDLGQLATDGEGREHDRQRPDEHSHHQKATSTPTAGRKGNMLKPDRTGGARS